MAHYRRHLAEDRLHAEAVLEGATEELHQLRQLLVDEGLVEHAGQEVLEEEHRIERRQVDPHLAVGAHRPAELRDRELELTLDVGVGLGIGAGEDETAHPVGVLQGQLLRDHPAHRHADDVRAGDPERVEQADGVVGHLVDGVRAGRLGAPADAAVVEDDRAVVPREVGHLEHPRRGIRGEAHDEEERISAALLVVVEVDRAHLGDAHPSTSPRTVSHCWPNRT